MDRNTLLAFLLIGLIILLWPVWMRKVVGTKEPIRETIAESEEQQSEILEESQTPQPVSSSEETLKARKEPSRRIEASSITRGVRPDTIVVETDFYRGLLSSAGGGTILSWKLKKYLKGEKEDRKWVELIPDSAEGNMGLVMGVDLSRIVFDVEYDTLGETKEYKFVHDLSDGRRVEKEFHVLPNSYHIEMLVRLVSFRRDEIGEAYSVQWKSGLQPTEKNVKDDLHYYEAYALQGGELLKSKGDSKTQTGDTEWVAVRTKYFLVALIPKEPLGMAAKLRGEKIEIAYREDGLKEDWRRYHVQLDMPFRGQLEETARFALYLGPMDYQQLRSYDVKLEKMMNFGWMIIRPFSIGFFYALQRIHGIVHNYGWAIIIFSILIKVVLYPLTRKSYQSMRKMQELQPKMAALKEKYKKDPQKMNQETMKLYKQHGVNPMGGCLPLLLQMPVLFALFNLFRTTIMLRQASFLGGLIKDLSAPDAMLPIRGGINLLPILMAATMIIQQKLATQNPQQKAMAYFMPVFLMFIFYRLSAGLNLYYLMFNVLTILQEMIIRKK